MKKLSAMRAIFFVFVLMAATAFGSISAGRIFNVNGGGLFNGGVDTLQDGNFVVTWTSSQPYAKIFDSFGDTVVEHFRVGSGENCFIPSVSGLKNGNFVIAWNEKGRGVFGQIFDSSGSEVSSVFTVHETEYEEMDIPVVLTTFENDNTAVIWRESCALFGVLLNEVGDVIIPMFNVSTNTGVGALGHPSSDLLISGNFVVVWYSNQGVTGQILSQEGEKILEEFSVHALGWPSVAGLQNGNFAFIWDGGLDLRGQVFNENWDKIGDEFELDDVNNFQGNPRVAAIKDSSFIAVWDTSDAIYAQAFDEFGVKRGDQYKLSESGIGANIAAFQSGFDFVVAWGRSISGRIITVGFHVTNNIDQALHYREEFPVNLLKINIISEDSNLEAFATMKFSDVGAGSLNEKILSDAASVFDPVLGEWNASGTVGGVNNVFDDLIFTPTPNYSLDFNISVVVEDKDGFAREGTIQFIAIPKPVVITSPEPLVYECVETFVDDSIQIISQEEIELQNAIVYLGGDSSDVDSLNFENQYGINGYYDNEKLILYGTTTLDNYQKALRKVTYFHLGEFVSSNTVNVSFVVSDGERESSVVTRSIIVDAIGSKCGDDDSDDGYDDDDNNNNNSNVMIELIWGTAVGTVIGGTMIAVSLACCLASVLVIKKIKTNTKYYKKVPNLPDDISLSESASSTVEQTIDMQDIDVKL